VSERTSAVDALTLYHDLWDLKLRAERMNRSFLVYLLQVALEDLQGGTRQWRAGRRRMTDRRPSGGEAAVAEQSSLAPAPEV
jgi:hypothetical protein